MRTCHVELTDAGTALAFWHDSPHATVFTQPEVLSRLSSSVDWWVARRGAELLCMWPVCRNADDVVAAPVFSYYVGPLWSKQALSMPAHRWLAVTSGVYRGFISALIARYGVIQASLPVGLHDVRAFDWWNYGHEKAPRFQIRPRYTARIDGLQQSGLAEILANTRTLRRREYRRIERSPILRGHACSADELVGLYCDVLHERPQTLAPLLRAELETLLALTEQGQGDAITFRDPGSGAAISVALLLYGKQTANLVINAVAPAWRSSGLGAWTMVHAILAARERGMDTFDFNGANSPNRGDDKHSYGAYPALFFDVNYPYVAGAA